MSHASVAARGRWAPVPARVLAWRSVALTSVPAVIGLFMMASDLGKSGEKFDGLGVAVGALFLAVAALAAVPLVWFLTRGGRAAFWIGMVVTASLLLAGAWMGFLGLLG